MSEHNGASLFSVELCGQDAVIMRVRKSLDCRTADAFKSAYKEHLAAGKRDFILDFSQTGILDSTGLGALFSLYRSVRHLKGRVVLAAVSRSVQIVVQLTAIHKVFRQFATVEEACEALQYE